VGSCETCVRRSGKSQVQLANARRGNNGRRSTYRCPPPHNNWSETSQVAIGVTEDADIGKAIGLDQQRRALTSEPHQPCPPADHNGSLKNEWDSGLAPTELNLAKWQPWRSLNNLHCSSADNQ